MCFYVPKGAKELTAKEDIVCYKVINKNNKSKFQSFKYSPNTTYRLRKKLKPIRYNNGKLRKIDPGFHSYCGLDGIECFPSEKIVQMIIPKGAKYYKNTEDGEYVSTSIRTGSLEEYVPHTWLT